MKTTDIIRRAGRNLKRAKMRTFLTSVAIAVGGFAIMASLMAGEGARQYVDRIISNNINPSGLMISKDEAVMQAGGSGQKALREYNPNAVQAYGQEYKTLNQDELEKLRQRSDLKNVEPTYQLQPKYLAFSAKSDKKYTGDVMMRDQDIRMESLKGKALNKGVQLADDEVAIPEAYLEEIGKSASEVIGTKLTITVEQTPQKVDEAKIMEVYLTRGEAGVSELTKPKQLNKEFTIAAITKKSPDQMTNTPNTYVSPAAAKELSEFSTLGTDLHQKYVTVLATAADGKDPEKVKESLKEAGFSALTSKDIQGMLFQFVNTLQGLVMGFGALALIVSVFGIVNTQYISVLERTQQIGLMKALGASRRDIGRLFRYEAAWVGFLGGALGVLAAWGAGTALNPWISEQINLGEHHLLVFRSEYAIAVVVVLMLVAIVAGLLPSRKAAKLDPIEALRTE